MEPWCADCSNQYANNQFRALQQFFKWHATEDPDEPRRNPMASMKPPNIGGKLVPVITDGELSALLAACKGGGFENRRDYAVISLFRDTGARLSELSGLGTEDLSAHDRDMWWHEPAVAAGRQCSATQRCNPEDYLLAGAITR